MLTCSVVAEEYSSNNRWIETAVRHCASLPDEFTPAAHIATSAAPWPLRSCCRHSTTRGATDRSQGETDPPELLHLAFQLYDTEGKGHITLPDLRAVMQTIGRVHPRHPPRGARESEPNPTLSSCSALSGPLQVGPSDCEP